MTWLIVLYLPSLVAFILVSRRRGGLVNPDGLFILFNTVMLVGTTIVVDPRQVEQVRYAWLVLLATSVFTIVATVIRSSWGPGERTTTTEVRPIELNNRIWLLYALSLLVCLGYYNAVGHITFVSSLNQLSQGGTYDSATERLASYGGAKYFFPGYVNQFKNSILPVITVAIVHSLWVNKRTGRLPYSILLVGTMLVMVAGTGQRGATVIVFLVVVAACFKARLLNGFRIVVAGCGGFAIFILLTVAVQRNTTQLQQATTFWDRISVFGDALWSRVFLENAASGVAAFHYTQGLPTAWGAQWLDDLMGILPGNRGSDLANRVFEMLYGTSRGTAPESIWGGAYYNFSLVGLIVVPAILAIAMTLLTRRYFLATQRGTKEIPNFLTLLALSGMAISLGSWVAGSPMSPLNTGFPTYLFLYWFSRRDQHRDMAETPQVPGDIASLREPEEARLSHTRP